MIHTVIATNYLNESLEISLTNADDHGLVITNIDGIGGGEADINIGDFATANGGYFNSSRALSRVITLDILFKEAPTIEVARRNTYRFFPIRKKVTLEFITDTRHTMIEGYVESNEATIFSPKTGTSISVVCPKASLEAKEYSEAKFYGEEPLFTFPFINTLPTTPTLVFGDVRLDAEEYVYYDGEMETGMYISIKIYGLVENIRIYNVRTNESMYIITDNIEKITGHKLKLGDEILISTIAGDKYARLLRNGVYTNILNAIDRDSQWMTLSRGDNVFSYTASEGADDMEYTLTYKPLYEGV